jgi:hypothetical protein
MVVRKDDLLDHTGNGASVPTGRPLGNPGADAPAERDRNGGGGDRGDPEHF